MARIDRHDAGAQPDTLRRVRVRGEHEESVPPEAVRQPHALEAEDFGAARQVDPGREAVAGGEVGTQAARGPGHGRLAYQTRSPAHARHAASSSRGRLRRLGEVRY